MVKDKYEPGDIIWPFVKHYHILARGSPFEVTKVYQRVLYAKNKDGAERNFPLPLWTIEKKGDK